MRIVLDTNILVSALFWDGNERRLLVAYLEGDHTLVTSPVLLDETKRVLADKFRFPADHTAAFLALLRRHAVVVHPQETLAVVTADPSDDRVLECAAEGRVELIVTGDRHLLALDAFRGIPIVNTAAALRRLIP